MNQKIKVGLVQLNNSFSNQYYLPLSVGMLQAYAIRHIINSHNIHFKDPIYKFMDIFDASDYLSECDIVGFSVYVWNEQNSLAIAKEYKKKNPNGIVVFGGPQVPNSHKRFSRFKNIEITESEKKQERINFTPNYHKEYPFIDILCHGEGERVFKIILEQMLIDKCRDKSQIPSISYVDNNKFYFNKILDRMKDEDLAKTPSPFTENIFGGLMANAPNQKWILMYETDRGCPYMCTYCDWGGATEDKISKFTLEQINEDLKWVGKNKIPYIFLCNANFGILKRDVQIAEFFAQIKKEYGFPEGVTTQNAKNPKKHTIQALEILENAGLNKATVMSQQSTNLKTLEAVRRDNMKLDEYQSIQNQLASEGVYTMTDLIFPMPEETYESIKFAVDTLINNGQHNKIQFNNLSILRNTEMGNPEYQKRYNMKIIRSKIINSHGKKNELVSGIEEYQELVVSTNTMPDKEWVKTREFCWMTNFLYFNKLLQIPIILLKEIGNLTFEEIIETFCIDHGKNFPIISEIHNYFFNLAVKIQSGVHEEFVYSDKWLSIYWPPEEFVLIKLIDENKFEEFYNEVNNLINKVWPNLVNTKLIKEGIELNKNLFKLPKKNQILKIKISYNIVDFYKSIIVGKKIKLEKKQISITIDKRKENWDSLEKWCQEVVWYGNRRGAYLYGNLSQHTEFAGHH